jgi:hypothetical protein
MTGNVLISEVDAPMYVALSKAEKHASYEALVDTALQLRCRKNNIEMRDCSLVNRLVSK